MTFQSTLPARGATYSHVCIICHQCNFNPRSPHGERQVSLHSSGNFHLFQSTLPARGATRAQRWNRLVEIFQSTLPARGATVPLNRCRVSTADFNPRSPHGERRGESQFPGGIMIFQSTLPARGATWERVGMGADRTDFNPRSPHGERRARLAWSSSTSRNFNPRSPHGERPV